METQLVIRWSCTMLLPFFPCFDVPKESREKPKRHLERRLHQWICCWMVLQSFSCAGAMPLTNQACQLDSRDTWILVVKGGNVYQLWLNFANKRCSSSVLKHQSCGLQLSLKTASTSGSNFRAIKAPTWQKPFDGPNMKSSPLKLWESHHLPHYLMAINPGRPPVRTAAPASCWQFHGYWHKIVEPEANEETDHPITLFFCGVRSTIMRNSACCSFGLRPQFGLLTCT